MNSSIAAKCAAAALVALVMALSADVMAGGVIQVDEDKSISIGAGLRTSFSSTEDAAPSGKGSSKTFALESMRLYVGGSINKNISFTFNTEYDGALMHVLDGYAEFAYWKNVKIWAGRFLPPSDRSTFDGPYYLATWDFPMVSAYPAIFAGRDDGIAFWGEAPDSKWKWQVGAFEGRQGGSNQSDNPLYAGRLTFSLWDPEPGYYNSSTYYGTKNVLSLGIAGMSQKDGAGTAAAPADFTGYNLDLLLEKKMGEEGNGAVSLEGAYYKYNTGNVADAIPQGKSYFVLAGYLFPKTEGSMGQFQPHIRYQKFDFDAAADTTRIDVGVHYIMDGHNNRFSLIYANTKVTGGASTSKWLLGSQLQF